MIRGQDQILMNQQDFPDWGGIISIDWISLHDFSRYYCSYFVVALSWRHCSCSLSNYVYKFISNLVITASDVDFFSMASVLVLSFSGFIISISLKRCTIFNTFLLMMWSIPFFCVYYVPVPLTRFIFPLQFSHLPIVEEYYFFHLILLQKINRGFKPSFRCRCIFFTWSSFVLSSISSFKFVDSGGCSLKKLMKVILFFLGRSLLFHKDIILVIQLIQLLLKYLTIWDRFFCYLFSRFLVRL